jgi:hypothetical protein
MLSKKLNGPLLILVLVASPLFSEAADPASEQLQESAPAAPTQGGTQVQGKGAGMGKSYQKNVAGPGQGEPEYHGSDAGKMGEQESTVDNAQQVRTESQAQTQEEVRSRKAQDGSGYGAGPGGDRGQGSEGTPHHGQHGSSRAGKPN